MHTFSIITVKASPKRAEIHHEKERMPLILTGDAAAAWVLPDLTQEEMKDLMKTNLDEHALESYRVLGTAVVSVKVCNLIFLI